MIHPSSIVETIKIGKNTNIGPFCYIGKNVIIGDDCNLVGHCSIGRDPQFKDRRSAGGIIKIMNNVEIREFVTVNSPINDITYIGNDCLLMCNSHIPHDCYIDDHTVIVVGAAIGGNSVIGKHCTIGLNATLHQNSKLENYCIIGANSFFKGESCAGITYVGIPAIPSKINLVGINRYAPDDEKEDLKTQAMLFIEDNK